MSLPEMKRLAMRFHEALDYFEREGISQENEEPLSTIVYRRQEFETKGFVSESVPEGKLPRYRELFPWFEGRSLHRKYDHLDWNFEANLDEAIDIIRRAYLAYDRVPDKTEMYPDSIVDLAKRIDIGEYYSARRYWATIAYLEQMVSHDPEYYSANYLYRNADREWEVTRGDPDPSLTSYVGIKLDLLTLKAWSKA